MNSNSPKIIDLNELINLDLHPIDDQIYRQHCRNQLDDQGVLVLYDFLKPSAIAEARKEGLNKQHLAYYCSSTHNVYLTPKDANLSDDHIFNRQIISTKGCITDEEISKDSCLKQIYHHPNYQDFLCRVLNEKALFPYADLLSSVNIHYANEGQELGWHFDNSAFAITLLIQSPKAGGKFQYVKNLRNSATNDQNFKGVQNVMDTQEGVEELDMRLGALILFRGRDSMHRVTPVIGDTTRILVVMAYNNQPNIMLSPSARMSFYGRL